MIWNIFVCVDLCTQVCSNACFEIWNEKLSFKIMSIDFILEIKIQRFTANFSMFSSIKKMKDIWVMSLRKFNFFPVIMIIPYKYEIKNAQFLHMKKHKIHIRLIQPYIFCQYYYLTIGYYVFLVWCISCWRDIIT